MDWRKLVGKTETLVLPYVGGARVDAPDRRLRVTEEVSPGWWSFRVEGRRATAIETASPPDLSHLPRARGHFAHGWLFTSGARAERLALLPEEQPPELVPVVARRWSDNLLVFESTDFEGDAEEPARRALEEGSAITDVKGATPALRAAFAYCMLFSSANRLSIAISVFESIPHIATVAGGGRDAAEHTLASIEEERRQAHARAEQRAIEASRETPRQWRGQTRAQVPTTDNAEERIEAALASADATLRSTRRLERNEFEVVYAFMGQRFITRVDGVSLTVIDAGVCLDGEDSLVTLESLPGVIREAIDRGRLVITRR